MDLGNDRRAEVAADLRLLRLRRRSRDQSAAGRRGVANDGLSRHGSPIRLERSIHGPVRLRLRSERRADFEPRTPLARGRGVRDGAAAATIGVARGVGAVVTFAWPRGAELEDRRHGQASLATAPGPTPNPEPETLNAERLRLRILRRT